MTEKTNRASYNAVRGALGWAVDNAVYGAVDRALNVDVTNAVDGADAVSWAMHRAVNGAIYGAVNGMSDPAHPALQDYLGEACARGAS